jgi:hypothetical protein
VPTIFPIVIERIPKILQHLMNPRQAG